MQTTNRRPKHLLAFAIIPLFLAFSLYPKEIERWEYGILVLSTTEALSEKASSNISWSGPAGVAKTKSGSQLLKSLGGPELEEASTTTIANYLGQQGWDLVSLTFSSINRTYGTKMEQGRAIGPYGAVSTGAYASRGGTDSFYYTYAFKRRIRD